ncbi:MAG: hypothetical protein ABIH82_06420 [Candidatus Woesearchaeota archaeon]
MVDHKVKSVIVILVLVIAVGVVGLIAGNGMTGGAIINTVACYDHADCNDNIAVTEDVCKNPGTIHSLCVNRPIK